MKYSLPLLFSCVWLGTLILAATDTLRADDFLPSVDTGKVVVRTIPNYPAIESEVSGSVEKDWNRGYRQCARYVASIDNELRWPVVVTYPDWKEQEPQEKTRMLVHLILNTQKEFGLPKEKGLAMTDQPAITVACYSMHGAYTLENFKKGLAEIQTHLKNHNIPAAGPPRVLYYNNPAWVPSWFLLQEVQVPVPTSATPSQ